MRIKNFVNILIMFIFISSSTFISSGILFESGENNENSSNTDMQDLQPLNDSSNTSSDRLSIIEWLLEKYLEIRFKLGGYSMGFPYYYFQLVTPSPIQSFPEMVEIEYMNETTVEVGAKHPENPDKWKTLLNTTGEYDWGWFISSTSFRFELLPPENISQDALFYTFDPPFITINPNKDNLDWPGADIPLKTNFSFEIKPSDDSTNPTQDIILKVKVTRVETVALRDIRRPPTFAAPGIRDQYEEIRFWKNMPFYYILYHFFYGRMFYRINFGGPSTEERVEGIVHILVRIKKDHYAELIPPDPVDIRPNQVLSIPVEVINRGSHIDTFNFKVNVSDERLKVGQPSALTIEPGETRNAYVTVISPPVFQDVGKTTSIDIEAYSIEKPELVFSNKVIITTQGVYVSAGIAYYLILAGMFLLFILFIIFIFRRIRFAKIYVKPEKTWDIPIEKSNLKKLKKTDKEAYKSEMMMMQDEYQSALLWFNDYKKFIRKEKIKIPKEKIPKDKKEKQKLDIIGNIKKVLIKIFIKSEEKTVKKEKEPEKKEEPDKKEPKEEPKMVKEEEQIKPIKQIDIELENKKQAALEKIRRAQEKQRKKIKK